MSPASRRATQFTIERLDWAPWIETVTEIGLSDEELAAVYEQAPNAKGSPYFATLALDLPALVERTGLFNNTMRSPGGGSNAERELAATAVSRINGCVYCASVHAQRYVQYAKRPEVMDRLLEEGVDAPLNDAREQAIVDFSAKLTRNPAGLTSDDIKPLRVAGLTDLEIYDIAQSAAMFAWANRLMQTLGDAVYPQ
ncbi:MAG TPA: peroxidase-related enzyme [Thermomicrobiales bacterium]|nr:peroxidase-related enzyme [Thermomicrobiales bacterium]